MVHWTSKKTALLSTCILRDEKKLSTYEMKMDKVFLKKNHWSLEIVSTRTRLIAHLGGNS